jgi:hypothetical protein
MLHYNVTSIHDLTDRWRIEWERHHRQVMVFFARTAFRFLVCRIETDLPHLLHDALPECKLDSTHYRVKGGGESSQRDSVLAAAMRTARKFRSLIRVPTWHEQASEMVAESAGSHQCKAQE